MTEEFDFIRDETATSGSPNNAEGVVSDEETPELVLGALTPEVIAEARRLAESKKGLDINSFFTKHQLVNVSIDRLLHGKLDKDGCLL